MQTQTEMPNQVWVNRPQYAPTAPLALHQQMAKEGAGIFGKYHLLLAHDIIAHPEEYRELFCNPEMFVIVDNSLIELGESVNVRTLFDAADIVDANVVVAPDVLGKRAESVEILRRAIDEGLLEHPRCQVMSVVQGNAFSEMEDHIEEVSGLMDGQAFHWGVPRHVANTLGTRRNVIKLLSDTIPLQLNIHLLGMSKYLADDIACSHMEDVMGIDSANPIVLGLHGINLGLEHIELYEHLSRTHDDWDYMDQTELTHNALNNIDRMRQYMAANPIKRYVKVERP